MIVDIGIMIVAGWVCYRCAKWAVVNNAKNKQDRENQRMKEHIRKRDHHGE